MLDAMSLLRDLPSVHKLLSDARLADLPHRVVLPLVRAQVDAVRQRILAGELDAVPDVAALVRADWDALATMRLTRVVNATGVVVHTNLGRAPLPAAAVSAVTQVASGYSNLEMDLPSGQRGGRLEGIQGPLCALLGCEDAIAVNNNAAAVVLALAALAQGREVVVSRGELVEIGGSFRVPDIMRTSGATLVEVGSTNRTRAADYARAITPETALVMRVHPSNYRIIGFTERPSTQELGTLSVPLYEDLGSGALVPCSDEPLVGEVLRQGAALVSFSGDKLLGGPQAGILAGRKDLIQACRRHPLYRAMRLDKLVLAALEATLRVYLQGQTEQIPVHAMLGSRGRGRADALCAALVDAGLRARVAQDVGYTGGGALPEQALPAHVVRISGLPAADTARWLRTWDGVPVVARVQGGDVVVDPRTFVQPDDADIVCSALQAAAAALG